MTEASELDRDAARGHADHGLALGLVAMAPLLVLGEVAGSLAPETGRSAAQALLFLVLEPAGAAGDSLRRLILLAVLIAAVLRLVRQKVPLVPKVLRRLGEGALGAIVLGPLLLALGPLVGALLSPWGWGSPSAFSPLAGRLGEATSTGAAPSLSTGALVASAGAWEEILCRVLLYGLLLLLVRRTGLLLGLGKRLSTLAGEVVGLLGSAVLFATLHLEIVLGSLGPWLGGGGMAGGAMGEPFEPAVFTWRCTAGILLGLLFRWRGPGVAAWTHALFNLGLLLGAGPGVLL